MLEQPWVFGVALTEAIPDHQHPTLQPVARIGEDDVLKPAKRGEVFKFNLKWKRSNAA